MKSFKHILIFGFYFFLIPNSTLISAMEPQATQEGQKVSSIPALRILVARQLFRQSCDDIDFWKNTAKSPYITEDAKHYICNGAVEMDSAVRQFVVALVKMHDPQAFVIELNKAGIKFLHHMNKICGGIFLCMHCGTSALMLQDF